MGASLRYPATSQETGGGLWTQEENNSSLNDSGITVITTSITVSCWLMGGAAVRRRNVCSTCLKCSALGFGGSWHFLLSMTCRCFLNGCIQRFELTCIYSSSWPLEQQSVESLRVSLPIEVGRWVGEDVQGTATLTCHLAMGTWRDSVSLSTIILPKGFPIRSTGAGSLSRASHVGKMAVILPEDLVKGSARWVMNNDPVY